MRWFIDVQCELESQPIILQFIPCSVAALQASHPDNLPAPARTHHLRRQFLRSLAEAALSNARR